MICGSRWGQEPHALIPGSQLVVPDGVGHLVHIEEPGALPLAARRSATARWVVATDLRSGTPARSGQAAGATASAHSPPPVIRAGAVHR
ncbi:hypothetical protein ACFW9I_29010 [[Kitasatospora] papulosa]|uniref:hypothetical protein n=1 Tax=[Kitasatospora] papulosa TaxID=1464011 RepID=UPI0036754924